MITNDERRRVAERLKMKLAGGSPHSICESVRYALSAKEREGNFDVLSRLANLIDPDGGHDAGKSSDPTEQGVESIKEWCLGAMEGADGALDSMLCEIVGAIEDYRHPERIEYVSFKDIGCANCDSLLKLADEMADDADSFGRSARLAVDEGDRKMAVLFASIADDYIERADRIRSALGVSRGDQQKA